MIGNAEVPFVGRDTELARILEAAKDTRGSCILLVGPPGAGKTWLIDQSVHCLQQDSQLEKVMHINLDLDGRFGVVPNLLEAELEICEYSGRSESHNGHEVTESSSPLLFKILSTYSTLNSREIAIETQQDHLGDADWLFFNLPPTLFTSYGDMYTPDMNSLISSFLKTLRQLSDSIPSSGRGLIEIRLTSRFSPFVCQFLDGVIASLPSRLLVIVESESDYVDGLHLQMPTLTLAPLPVSVWNSLLSSGYKQGEIENLHYLFGGTPFALTCLQRLLPSRHLSREADWHLGLTIEMLLSNLLSQLSPEQMLVIKSLSLMHIPVDGPTLVQLAGLADLDLVDKLLSGPIMCFLVRKTRKRQRSVYELANSFVRNAAQSLISSSEHRKINTIAGGLFADLAIENMFSEPKALICALWHLRAAESYSFVDLMTFGPARVLMRGLALHSSIDGMLIEAQGFARIAADQRAEQALFEESAYASQQEGQVEDALRLLEKALESSSTAFDQAAVMEQIAWLHGHSGRLELAIDCLIRVSAIYEALQDAPSHLEHVVLHGRARTAHNLGLLLMRTGDYSGALSKLESAMELDVKAGNTRGQAEDLRQIGLVYQEMSLPQEAIDAFQKALKLDASVHNDHGIAVCAGNIGGIYFYSLNAPEQAVKYVIQAMGLFEELGDISNAEKAATLLAQIRDRDRVDSSIF